MCFTTSPNKDDGYEAQVQKDICQVVHKKQV